MARERESDLSRDEAGSEPRDGRSGVATGALLGAVACVLVAGIALRTSPPGEEPDRLAAPPDASPTRVEASEGAPDPLSVATPVPPRVPSPAPLDLRGERSPEAAAAAIPHDLDLPLRADEDAFRLRRASGKFTAQILLACSSENVRRVARASRGGGPLYLLAAPDRGDGCYRVCWGSYPTPREAADAADLPAALRPSSGKPLAKRIAEVLP